MEDGGWKMAESGKALVAPSSIFHPPSSPSSSSPSSLRRRLQAIARCPAAVGLANELYTLQRIVHRKTAQGGRHAADPVQRERLKRLQSIHEAQTGLTADVIKLEDALLLNLYESTPLPYDESEIAGRISELRAQTERLLLDLYSLNQGDPHALTLGLYGNAPAELFSLAQAYREVAGESTLSEKAVSVSVGYYTRLGKSSFQRTTLAQKEIDAFLSEPRAGVHGIVLSIRAPYARARFEPE